MNQTILQTIGNTPLVKLNKLAPPDSADVFVKLEYFNPTGSYKDRMALAMIEEAEKRGDLRPGMSVVECTGGSTGSSLAMICAVKGYPFRVISSNAYAEEKLNTMRAFGADLDLVISPEGKITPTLLPSMMRKAREMAQTGNAYYTNQFHNTDELVGYEKIGLELREQLDHKIDVFCAAVGTAGMLMGVAKNLRQSDPGIQIIAFEPATSAILSGGEAGSHTVEGVGVGFVPPLLEKEFYNEARAVQETEGREIARRLAKEEGIFAGTSTGLNVLGALQIAEELGKGHTVVTVACDTGLKYLGGNLYRD